MIEFTKSYKTADGQVFATIEDAKRHELILALKIPNVPATANLPYEDMATLILTVQDEIVDILTMTPNSKPKARKMHGGTKNRTKKTVITDATTDANRTMDPDGLPRP